MTEAANTCISSALEDYLEAIYFLSIKKPTVRITDVALHLGISKPSVNRAVNSLKRLNLVTHEPYGDILLTDAGKNLGYDMYGKHKQIKNFLEKVLKLDSDEAEKETCLIEHNISKSTVEKMISYMESSKAI